ncbi:MAG: hypothetical protein UZ22_OP11002000799 [Microgenomates bacterium OLB23]|nr:MAG: hypothetical protein UZ22_OP11002000799 [Microgenomates bacterium OLB23]
MGVFSLFFSLSKIGYNSAVSSIKTILTLLAVVPLLRNYWRWLVFFNLAVIALIFRWYPIHGGLFTFEYDMAKDSLIMLKMYQHQDPSLVGPTTSIPGLFYGPAWYYIALIPNILLGFDPFAGVGSGVARGSCFDLPPASLS